MLRAFKYFLFCILLWILHLPRLTAQGNQRNPATTDTLFSPVKIITRDDWRKMGINTLAELFRYELNMELEQYPADGGAKVRVGDLDSRQFKILVNGIPVGGSDMFGGRVDVSEIALINVDTVCMTYAPAGVEYGSGTLSGTANIITHKGTDAAKFSLQAYVQEESAANEYNLHSGVNAAGRRQQGLSVSGRLFNRISIGGSGMRNAFEGYRGAFNGKQYVTAPDASRGFEWSPYTSWNGNGYLSYESKRLSAYYTYSHYQSALTFYGHSVQQEFDDGVPLPRYTATDYDYQVESNRHHLHVQGKWWRDAAITIDLSYQNNWNDRKIYMVNTGTNQQVDNEQRVRLYSSKTGYAKIKVDKPVNRYVQWNVGIEADHTKGYMAAAPGTYQSRVLDEVVVSVAGFTGLHWQLHRRWSVRLSGNGLYKTWFSGALAVNYDAGRNHHFKLLMEQVRRFPNYRELFTYLESEYNLLEGDRLLKPETGRVLLVAWQNQFINSGGLLLKGGLQSAFRQLTDRIVITPVPFKVPTQDAYRYGNRNKYYSWLTRGDLTAKTARFNINAAVSFIGTKGNDFATANQYDKFLFHAEAGAAISYTFKWGAWLQTNYRFVGRQAIYSYERISSSTDLIRVYNRAPAYHLLDVGMGKSFFRQHVEVAAGIRNGWNVQQIKFSAVDQQEHYTGDLRTMYIGYGRGGYLRLSYNM